MPLLDWRQNHDLRAFAWIARGCRGRHVEGMAPGTGLLDQGPDGSCVGHGFAAAVSAVHPGVNHHTALAYYELATSRDPYVERVTVVAYP